MSIIDYKKNESKANDGVKRENGSFKEELQERQKDEDEARY